MLGGSITEFSSDGYIYIYFLTVFNLFLAMFYER